MYNWHKNEFDESFYLQNKDNRIVCCLHPKHTRQYALHLAKKIFKDIRELNKWYIRVNFWYGDRAPIDMGDNELIQTIKQIEYGVYI